MLFKTTVYFILLFYFFVALGIIIVADRLVDAVIDALGLSAKRNVVVGDLGSQSSLSGILLYYNSILFVNLFYHLIGGQRKRVSIGMELVICPSILLLDEPTSGLDSKTALSLIDLLQKEVCTMGINVIAVLHQPRYEICTLFSLFFLILIVCTAVNACNNITILASGDIKYFGKHCLYSPHP